MDHLRQNGIGSRPFFWPMHEQPVFRKMGLFRGENYSNAEFIGRRGFYIPSGLTLSDEEMVTVVEKLGLIMSEVS